MHTRQANSLQCFKSLLKTHLFKGSFLYFAYCILYLSLIVYFIVSFMRLEAFVLGALQMSYYYYYYYYYRQECQHG